VYAVVTFTMPCFSIYNSIYSQFIQLTKIGAKRDKSRKSFLYILRLNTVILCGLGIQFKSFSILTKVASVSLLFSQFIASLVNLLQDFNISLTLDQLHLSEESVPYPKHYKSILVRLGKSRAPGQSGITLVPYLLRANSNFSSLEAFFT